MSVSKRSPPKLAEYVAEAALRARNSHWTGCGSVVQGFEVEGRPAAGRKSRRCRRMSLQRVWGPRPMAAAAIQWRQTEAKHARRESAESMDGCPTARKRPARPSVRKNPTTHPGPELQSAHINSQHRFCPFRTSPNTCPVGKCPFHQPPAMPLTIFAASPTLALATLPGWPRGRGAPTISIECLPIVINRRSLLAMSRLTRYST
jgi:hypothetical protein